MPTKAEATAKKAAAKPDDGRVSKESAELAIADAKVTAKADAAAEYQPLIAALQLRLEAIDGAVTGVNLDLDGDDPGWSTTYETAVALHRRVQQLEGKTASQKDQIVALSETIEASRPPVPTDPGSKPIWAD